MSDFRFISILAALLYLSSCSENVEMRLVPEEGTLYRYSVRRITEHEGHKAKDHRLEKFQVQVTNVSKGTVETIENIKFVKDNGAVIISPVDSEETQSWARVTRSELGKTLTAQRSTVDDEMFRSVGLGIGMESRLPMFTFPEEEISEGDTWHGSTEFDGLFNMNIFTVTDIEDDRVLVNLVAAPTEEQTKTVHGLKGTMSGDLVFERPSFMLLQADLTLEEVDYDRKKFVYIHIDGERIR